MFGRKKNTYSYEKASSGAGRFSDRERKLITYILSKTLSVSERFTTHDVAQQIVGAVILSMPFLVTQEVWDLARALDGFRISLILFLTVFVNVSVLKFAKKEEVHGIWRRILSVIIVSYTFSFFVMYTVGIIGNVITEPLWAAKLVVLVSLFSSVGAATADILIFK
jgi:uncharacterized membrane protein